MPDEYVTMGEALDEWVDKNASLLRDDIACHVKVYTDEVLDGATGDDLTRLILISVRQWYENRQVARRVGEK